MLAAVMGRTPPPSVLEAARHKYAAIGGASPLVAIAQRLGGQLEAVWVEEDAGIAPVLPGMCFTSPTLVEVVDAMVGFKIQRLLYLSMTPFVSHAAWSAPLEMLITAAQPRGIDVIPVPAIGMTEPYIAGVVESIRDRSSTEIGLAKDMPVVFVAHSLPLDDPNEDPETYAEQLTKVAAIVAYEAAIDNWRVAYTSKGGRGGQWLEPTAAQALDEVAATGATEVLISPLGFATDHMEVLYDLDIAARRYAEGLGLTYHRAATLGDSQALVDAYVASVREVFSPASSRPSSQNPGAEL
jgi:ferrochelatase